MFEIDLQMETVQDYRDIYNIDLVRSLSMAIKQQMLLNKDQDLSYYLEANEPKMAEWGNSATVDLANFNVSGGEFTPANVMDVFKGVVPMISTINRNIRKSYRADPQYLVSGLKTASLLESLQDYVTHFPTASHGEAGFASRSGIDFRKQTVLASSSIPEDTIYVIYKNPSDDLSRSVILDFVYKPLYIIEEVTDSVKKTFVHSRTAIELVRPEAMGVVKVQNYASYFGT